MDEDSMALLAKARALSQAVEQVDLTPPDMSAAQHALARAHALLAKDDVTGAEPVWKKVFDEEGQPYYWNTKTDQTQYEVPTDFAANSAAARATADGDLVQPALDPAQLGSGVFINLPGTVSVIPGSSLVQTNQNLSTKVPKKVSGLPTVEKDEH
jgi:hypothetical protein